MSMKCVWYFEQGMFGWSEVYYNTGDDVMAAAASVPNDATTAPKPGTAGELFVKRLALLHPTAAIVHGRFSAIPGNRLYQDDDPPADVGAGRFHAGNPMSPAETWTSLLIEMAGGVGAGGPVHKRLYLRGLPEMIIGPPDSYLALKPFSDYLAAFFTTLQNGTWIIRSRVPKISQLPITFFDVSDTGKSAILQPILAGGQPGSFGLCVVRGLKAPAGWNGTHSFTVVTGPAQPGGLVMRLGPYKKSRPSGPPYGDDSGGTVDGGVYAELPITECHAERLVKRATGRPFGLSRGRR